MKSCGEGERERERQTDGRTDRERERERESEGENIRNSNELSHPRKPHNIWGANRPGGLTHPLCPGEKKK